MNCYRTSNNKFFTAPPRMADARHFTDYKESTKRNLMLQSEVESDNSYEYRMYLINNAEKLMDINNKKAFLINGVTECKQPYEQGTMLPEQSTQVCNTRTCKVVANDPNGLGLGRQYSDAPNPCLDGFSSAPMPLDNNQCAPANDVGNYFPAMQVENDLRRSVPGGGEMLSGGDPNQQPQ